MQRTRDGGADPLTISYDTLGNATLTDAMGNVSQIMRTDTDRIAELLNQTGQMASIVYKGESSSATGFTQPGGVSRLNWL